MSYKPILRWRTPDGEERTYEIPVGTIFIGRLTGKYLRELPLEERDTTAIYIIPVDPPGKPVRTGLYDKPYVSRLHVKITYDGEKLTVIDHGPYGTGSKNQTYVNGRVLEKGGSTVLYPDSEYSIRLTSRGPEFVVEWRMAEEKTIVVSSYTMMKVPRDVGEALQRERLASRVVEKRGSDEVFVAIEKVDRDLELRHGDKVIIVKSGQDGGDLARQLSELIDVLNDLHRSLSEKDFARAEELIAILELEQNRKLIERLEDEKLLENYVNMINALRIGPESGRQMVKKVLAQLRYVKRVRGL